MTTHYQRKHHQLIASCLENFNTDYLARHNILFGGGTRIALELDEYRESVDIDFLCPDINAYRHYGQSVVQQGLTRALQHWFANETDYASAAKDMAIEPAYYSNVILPAARRLAQSGEC